MKKYIISFLLVTSCLTPVWASKDEDFSDENQNLSKIIKLSETISLEEKNKKASLTFKGNEENIEILRQIALDKDHPEKFDAASALIFHSSEDRDLVLNIFVSIAQNPNDINRFDAAYELRCYRRKKDNEFLIPILRLMITQNYKYKGWAATELWKSPKKEDHEFARNFIPQIVEDESYSEVYRKNLIKLLRESNDPEDQKLGLALQLKYFPVKYSEELKKTMAQFNPDKFKEAAKQLNILKDLSELKMDLPKEFKKLIDSINSKNAKNPNYLHISAITGKKYSDKVDNEKEFIALRNNTMGFLKTLSGQKVDEGEKAEWEMYEENKPALINTLKHLVIALQDTSDTATRLNNLGIILNGLLYCPSGQSEGINSAVNTVIYGRNMTSGSYQDDGVCFEETLARLMFDVMNTAFRKAFGQEGRVHALSRARTVLHPYIGLPQAIEGFKEKISRVADEEIPGILEDFHKVFTKDFIATHILKNTETEKDMKVKGEERVKVKQERPLLISQMTAWLSAKKQDLSEYGIDSDLDDDGKVTMNLSIKPSHIIKILETMGYLNQ
jgi:hypothetical protein